MLIILLFALISGSFAQEILMHDLTLINRIRDINIVSLYLWSSGGDSKGENRLGDPLHPDSSITFTLPSGKCNILAFDELGNSYEIKGLLKKNAQDTLQIDLEYLSFNTPNIDYGNYPLNLFNSLSGFALDTVILSSPHLERNIVIDDCRVFPGNNITIWLDKGNYTMTAVDQIDRTYRIERISVPDDSCMFSISDNMICNPVVPVGITGNGSGALLIENCLPWTVLTELLISPDVNFDGIYLDDLSLQPGASIVIELDPGMYAVTASDERDGKYSMIIELTDSNTIRIPLTFDYLNFNFSFPDSQD